jgi:hypothetical protein
MQYAECDCVASQCDGANFKYIFLLQKQNIFIFMMEECTFAKLNFDPLEGTTIKENKNNNFWAEKSWEKLLNFEWSGQKYFKNAQKGWQSCTLELFDLLDKLISSYIQLLDISLPILILYYN